MFLDHINTLWDRVCIYKEVGVKKGVQLEVVYSNCVTVWQFRDLLPFSSGWAEIDLLRPTVLLWLTRIRISFCFFRKWKFCEWSRARLYMLRMQTGPADRQTAESSTFKDFSYAQYNNSPGYLERNELCVQSYVKYKHFPSQSHLEHSQHALCRSNNRRVFLNCIIRLGWYNMFSLLREDLASF